MAKNSDFALNSWDDVDRCLREIAECEITLGGIEAQMNMTINEAKEEAARLAKPMQTRVTTLTALVKAFVEDNRANIEGKTKALNFGRVGFRQRSRVSIPTKKISAIMKNLRNHGMDDCISVKETINKEVLEKYPDEDIAKVGASRKVEDRFWMETDKTKVKA
jgi:phage host-nuclease inhibitor protein Gam